MRFWRRLGRQKKATSSDTGSLSERALYFNHIPRTAGTSLRTWINSFFARKERCPALHADEFRNLSSIARDSYLFYAGHLQNLPWDLVSTQIPAMTVLRNPTDHLASLISYYVKVHVCAPKATDDEIQREANNLRDRYLFSDQAACWPAVNHQTKWLAALLPMAFAAVSNEAKLKAQKTFDHLFLVGTVDRLQETVDLLAWHRGWPHTVFDRRDNTTPSGGLLDDVPRPHLEQLLACDFELYTKANTRLDRDLLSVFGEAQTPEQRAAVINCKAEALACHRGK